MPALSRRTQRFPVSPVRRLTPLADEAKRAGKKVYHLNIGQPDIHTPRGFFLDLDHAPEVLAYNPSQGTLATRQALCAYYARHGIALDPDQVAITLGGSEAITMALLLTCNPGDELIVPEPFYANYRSFALIAGVTLVPVACSPERGFHLPERAHISAQITSKTKAILFCSPGNPTGVVYGRGEMERLRDVALEHGLYLISDEVYREFVYDGLEHVSLFELEGVEECGILVDSISKRFSACGARLGCLASRNPEVNLAAIKYAQARLSPPALSELGLIQLLNAPDYEAQVRSIVARFAARREVLFAGLKGIPGVTCSKPEGAFYVVAKLPVEDSQAFASWLLSDFDQDGETLMLAPASGFYLTPGLGRDEVRIAYVLNRVALKRALEVLRAGLKAYACRAT